VNRAAAVRQVWRWGWRLGPHLPTVVQRAIVAVGTRAAVLRPGEHVRTLQRNLTIASGAPATPALVRAAVASYLRNVVESLTLPGWSRAEIRARVRVVGEDRLREAQRTRGVVVALPHSGNWDLAGAWACTTGLPVTSVAERLDDAEFADFLAFRRSLGMEIHSHRDPGLVSTLVGAVRAGRVVCLLADRDLTGGAGIPVRWGGRSITAPAGPALVARLSGAALFPGVCRYTGRVGTGGMVITLGEEVVHRPGRDGLVAMTQDVIDHFAGQVAEAPQDWHLMQQFFGPAASEQTGERPWG